MNSCGGGGIYFVYKVCVVRKEGSHLRAPANSRQLYRRSHQRECHHEHRVSQTEDCEGAAKTMGYPEENHQNEEPMNPQLNRGESETAPAPNALHPAPQPH